MPLTPASSLGPSRTGFSHWDLLGKQPKGHVGTQGPAQRRAACHPPMEPGCACRSQRLSLRDIQSRQGLQLLSSLARGPKALGLRKQQKKEQLRKIFLNARRRSFRKQGVELLSVVWKETHMDLPRSSAALSCQPHAHTQVTARGRGCKLAFRQKRRPGKT